MRTPFHGLRSPTRRAFLGGLAAAGLLGPRASRAVQGAGRRFVFVWSDGGWDPLCVFAPMFGRADIEMEPRAEPWTPSGLQLVDHPDRPNVRSFFERYASRCSLVHGLSVPSVSHDVCALMAFTGSGGGDAPDWPSRLAHAAADAYALPSVVISGPSFPADRGVITSRVGAAGQLGALVDGGITGAFPTLSATTSNRVDALLERLVRPEVDPLVADWAESQRRTNELFAMADELALGVVADPASRVRAAVQTLAAGLARCVTIGSPYGLYWDSHANNASVQTYCYEELFASLQLLVDLLAATPSPQGGMLLDDTVVVCLSEMGRTPRLPG